MSLSITLDCLAGTTNVTSSCKKDFGEFLYSKIVSEVKIKLPKVEL